MLHRVSRREQLAALTAATALLCSASALPGTAISNQAGMHARELRQLQSVTAEDAAGPFHANWNSLGRYRTPDWFRDAKFGIFIHWGVFSVPAFGSEWYSRNMYVAGTPDFAHHVATYGAQTKFGYKDFIPLFRGERFDASGWVNLFASAGARYIVPVAEHCDGFPMYDSQLTAWDAAKMGPRRDVVGELEKATRARGLHFGVSSHRAEHWWWYDGGMRFPSDVQDAKYGGLYKPAEPMVLPGQPLGPEPDPDHLERWLPPDRAFLDDWLARSAELVDKYHPDLMYFDWWIGQPAFQPYLERFTAYYYDRADARRQPVVMTYKEHAMPENAAVLDVERGKLDTLRLLPWQTDTSISVKSWGYIRDDTYRSASSLLAELVDVVSKNGNLLLNVGPMSDGTIPPQERQVLLEMGRWLSENGDAIYGTRPWLVFGEGPTASKDSEKMGSDQQSYTSADIRYTEHAGALYAIALAAPKDGRLLMRSLFRGTPYLASPVCSVRLLGSTAAVQWRQESDGLRVTLSDVGAKGEPLALRIRTAGAGAGCA
jgi:alpha-L-fucosidase